MHRAPQHQNQRPKTKDDFLTLILNQRAHVVPRKLLPARQEFEFDYKHQSGDSSAEFLDKIADSLRSAAGRQQVVCDENSMTITYGVAMNLERVLSILEVI